MATPSSIPSQINPAVALIDPVYVTHIQPPTELENPSPLVGSVPNDGTGWISSDLFNANPSVKDIGEGEQAVVTHVSMRCMVRTERMRYEMTRFAISTLPLDKLFELRERANQPDLVLRDAIKEDLETKLKTMEIPMADPMDLALIEPSVRKEMYDAGCISNLPPGQITDDQKADSEAFALRLQEESTATKREIFQVLREAKAAFAQKYPEAWMKYMLHGFSPSASKQCQVLTAVFVCSKIESYRAFADIAAVANSIKSKVFSGLQKELRQQIVEREHMDSNNPCHVQLQKLDCTVRWAKKGSVSPGEIKETEVSAELNFNYHPTKA